MNIIQIKLGFPSQESCIAHVEKVRWGNKPDRDHIESINAYPFNGELRHQCNACRKSFNVTIGTILLDTRLPMQNWFLAISLILDAEKGHQQSPAGPRPGIAGQDGVETWRTYCKAMVDDGKLLPA